MIPDDPIIRSIERTGYPPWIDPDWTDWEEDEDPDGGVFDPDEEDYEHDA